MKSLVPIALSLALVVSFAPVPVVAEGNPQNAYQEGVALYNAGKFAEALPKFQQALAERPDFVHARSYLAKCQASIAQGLGPKNDLEGQLTRLIVPEINFSDAPIGDILDYFSSRAFELSGGNTVVNFIYQGTAEQIQGIHVTLALRNVPMSEAIKYVGQLSESRIKYEEHAIIVTPIAANEPATAAAPATDAPVSQ